LDGVGEPALQSAGRLDQGVGARAGVQHRALARAEVH
jgi:hypothetical protein